MVVNSLFRQRKLKRKKSRQAPGVSSDALQEAHDIFGDVDELLQLRKQGLDSSEWRERKLEDEFEPIILSEKYMTEKDDQIRELDVPERVQVLFTHPLLIYCNFRFHVTSAVFYSFLCRYTRKPLVLFHWMELV